MDTKTATQLFELHNILIGHCGKSLTPDVIDQISEEIKTAITNGPCSWAFRGTDPQSTIRLEKLTAERDALLKEDGADES